MKIREQKCFSNRSLARMFQLILLLPIGSLLLVLTTAFMVTPAQLESGQVVLSKPCPLALAGKPCSTCGLTRSFMAMAHGDLTGARAYHRLGPLAYLGTWAGLLAFVLIFIWVRKQARNL